MEKKRLHSFSWVPDLVHQRDNYFLTPVEKLPEKVELIANCLMLYIIKMNYVHALQTLLANQSSIF
jgi:hypothetical protein